MDPSVAASATAATESTKKPPGAAKKGTGTSKLPKATMSDGLKYKKAIAKEGYHATTVIDNSETQARLLTKKAKTVASLSDELDRCRAIVSDPGSSASDKDDVLRVLLSKMTHLKDAVMETATLSSKIQKDLVGHKKLAKKRKTTAENLESKRTKWETQVVNSARILNDMVSLVEAGVPQGHCNDTLAALVREKRDCFVSNREEAIDMDECGLSMADPPHSGTVQAPPGDRGGASGGAKGPPRGHLAGFLLTNPFQKFRVEAKPVVGSGGGAGGSGTAKNGQGATAPGRGAAATPLAT
jgi:hypothetical protein